MTVGYLNDKRRTAVQLKIVYKIAAKSYQLFRNKYYRNVFVLHCSEKSVLDLTVFVNDNSVDACKAHTHLCINIVADEIKTHMTALFVR